MASDNPGNSNLKIHAMLERFSKAFTKGDGKAAAKCWEVPALIVADMGTRAVSSLQEVENFYDASVKQYNGMGITDTRPEVKSTTWPTDRLAIVEVRWPYFDAKGQEVDTTESTTYVIRLGDDGEPRISVAIMMGVKN